jgi:4-hydroxybenzoyl-CoA reductase subunit beta
VLRLPPFRLDRPSTLRDAARILGEEGGSVRLVAGGTDLWPNLKRRHQRAERVVALGGIAELRGVREESDGSLRIGATTTLAEVESDPRIAGRFPSLAEAARSVSSPPLRNQGTIGGNLCLDTRCTYYNQSEEWRRSISYCMKAEGTICWVAPSSPRCWAVSSSDCAPMLWALGARVRLVSATGEREIPLEALYRDDGMEYLAKRPEEIVAEVVVPAAADARATRAAFLKLRRRGSIDFGVLSVAVAMRIDAGRVESARIVLGSIASLPAAADAAAALLVGTSLEDEALVAASRAARAAATPMDNTDLDPRWRGQVVPIHVERALRRAAAG